MKIMTIVGTRPEIIRLSRTIALLRRFTDHTLVHTGQNYDFELNQIFFEQLGIPSPDVYLEAAGAGPAETVANVIRKSDEILERKKPDAVLILGDTNSCLCAYPAKRRKIPIFHMEAGNRCFDQRVPEEINRKIVDHLADINMPYSAIARQYLLQEGFPADRIITTGSPMAEVLGFYRPKIDASEALDRLALEPDGYFLVSAHREENVDVPERLAMLAEALNGLAAEYRLPILYPVHPRSRRALESQGLALHDLVRTVKPLGFIDYVRLQMNARVVLSDSGTITEESSILGFAAVNIRDAHERPEGMEEAAVIMTGLDPRRILDAVSLLTSNEYKKESKIRTPRDYQTDNVSEKVLRIMMSYTDYVSKTVWRKY